MNAQHTQGRLKVQHPHAGERGWEIALEPGLEQVCQDVTEANARRLVACWNKFDGISIENIEDNLPVKELANHYHKALRERNELLDALKWLESANEHRACLVSVDDYIQHLRIRGMGDALTELDLARHAARAAISKATGGEV